MLSLDAAERLSKASMGYRKDADETAAEIEDRDIQRLAVVIQAELRALAIDLSTTIAMNSQPNA